MDPLTIRFPTDSFRQLPTLFKPNVPRRSADQARDGVSIMILQCEPLSNNSTEFPGQASGLTSDMLILIKPRCSSLYKNEASALQSSVYGSGRRVVGITSYANTKQKRHTLPTPVGPKNRKDAVGRLGACSPALDIRTASLTAATTWSWPTTRCCSACSIYHRTTNEPDDPTKNKRKITTYMHKLVPLPLQQILHRDARRPCHDA
jgi:hypothetical protein